jgi:hypothetical protein
MTIMQVRHLRQLVPHRKRRVIRPDRRAARQRQLRHAAALAHGQWRDECAAVRSTYRRWAGSPSGQKPVSFRAYTAALDREERAADRYARLIGSGGHIEKEESIVRPAETER